MKKIVEHSIYSTKVIKTEKNAENAKFYIMVSFIKKPAQTISERKPLKSNNHRSTHEIPHFQRMPRFSSNPITRAINRGKINKLDGLQDHRVTRVVPHRSAVHHLCSGLSSEALGCWPAAVFLRYVYTGERAQGVLENLRGNPKSIELRVDGPRGAALRSRAAPPRWFYEGSGSAAFIRPQRRAPRIGCVFMVASLSIPCSVDCRGRCDDL